MRETTIRQMVRGGVLRKIDRAVPEQSGVIVICDSETDPEHIVPRADGVRVRLLSFEAGVLTCGLGEGSDEELQGELGIDPDLAVIATIKRAVDVGFTRVVLVVNTRATAGPLAETSTGQLIDHMLRAAVEITDRVPRVEVVPVVHVPQGGSFTNYAASRQGWDRLYDRYERRVIGRDGEGAVPPPQVA